MRLYVNTENEIVYEYEQGGIFFGFFSFFANLFLLDKKLICLIHVAKKA